MLNAYLFEQWNPRLTVPTVEVFTKECHSRPRDFDIMGMRGTYHQGRVAELVKNFTSWKLERISGSRAFQSTYDRCESFGILNT